MMSRLSLIMVLIILFPAAGLGKEGRTRDFPRFTFGVEGSFAMGFLNHYHYNFIAAEGDRINVERTEFGLAGNGQILLNAGINIGRNFNLSVETGFCGVWKGERVIPVSLRGTWYSGKDPLADRWLVYAGIGGGVKDAPIVEQRLLGVAKIGGGRRISLNRSVKLDFLIGFHGAFIHPSVYQNVGGQAITGSSLRRNDAYIGALTFGIGLAF